MYTELDGCGKEQIRKIKHVSTNSYIGTVLTCSRGQQGQQVNEGD